MLVRIANFNTAEIRLTRLNKPAVARQIIIFFNSIFSQTAIPGSGPGDCGVISSDVREIELAG
jgi:hypothetical protein